MVTFVLDKNSSFKDSDFLILENGLLNIETIEDLKNLLFKIKYPITLSCGKSGIIRVNHPYDY